MTEEMCIKCGVAPRDPNAKKPLCTQCLIIEMKAFRERVEKELRRQKNEEQIAGRHPLESILEVL